MQSADFVHDRFYETETLEKLSFEVTRAIALVSVHPELVATSTELQHAYQGASAAKLVLHGVADS